MKKRALCLCLAAILVLLLAACGGKDAAKPYDAGAAEAILASGCFSEQLEELPATLIYDRLDGESLTSSVVYASTGATAEELAVLVCSDEKAAAAAKEVLQARIDAQKAVLASYQPREISKLDNALLEQRGSTVLMVVAADDAAVKAALADWEK